MEKKIKLITYAVILLLSILAVLTLFSSVSPLYWYVYEDKDAWCYLYGMMGVKGGALYLDYIEAVGPFFDIYNKAVTVIGGRSVCFVIDILVMSVTVSQSIKLVVDKTILSKHIIPSFLIFMFLYVSVANQLEMVDRVFGIGAGVTVFCLLKESLTASENRRGLLVFLAGIIFSFALFTRFNLLFLIFFVFLIIRKKIKVNFFLCGIVLVFALDIVVMAFGSYGARDLFCWWLKAGLLDYRSLIVGVYPAGIYFYFYFVGKIRQLYLNSEVIDHKRCFNRFLSCSVVMIVAIIWSLLMTIKIADRNLSYIVSGYEYGRDNAYKQLFENVPEKERDDIMGMANTVGFFISNEISPAGRPVVARGELYSYDASLLKRWQIDTAESSHQRIICNISQGVRENSQREVLKKYYVVESAASGFQMWKRR